MKENNVRPASKWSLAARDGLVLAAVTVVVTTLIFLTKNNLLATLLRLVKLGGSIWLLYVLMKKYGKSHPEESTFGYGLAVCVLSALVCAVWTFFEYQFLFPGAVTEAFEQMYANLEQMGPSMVPDGFSDVMLKMEDNYAQISCITIFFWCSLLGLIFSAILAKSTSNGGNRSIFTPEEMKKNNEDEFNF